MSSGHVERTVLVTGAQGFVGSWLSERLLDEGARVVALRRDVDPGARFLTEGVADRCVIAQADLLDYEAIVRVLNEHSVTEVFHLAAQTIVGTANRLPLSTFETNVRGNYLLLEACRAAREAGHEVRSIVVASSDKAYGSHDQLPYREDHELRAAYPYDVSKACTDMIARSYAVTYGLPIAVTRLANVYGGGDVNWSRLVPDTARALVAGTRPVLRSDGSPERDYLHVDDAVDAYLTVAASLEDESFTGRAWNAGWGEPVRVLEVVDRLIAASGRALTPDVQGEGTPSGEIDRQWLDSTSIREELGWSPKVALEDGLQRTFSWYERHLSER